METAIHFSNQSLISSFQDLKKKPIIAKVSKIHQKLARLASNTDFKALVEVIDENIAYIKSTLKFNPEKDTVESYGFRCMAAELVTDYLEEVKNLPLRYKKLKEEKEEKEAKKNG